MSSTQQSPLAVRSTTDTDSRSPNTPSSSNLNRIPGLGLLDSEQQNSSNRNLSTFIRTPSNPLPGIFLPDPQPNQQAPNLTDRNASPANSAKSNDSDSTFASIYNSASPKSVPMDISPSSKSDTTTTTTTTTTPALPSFFVAIKTRTSDQSMHTISDNGPVASSETRILGAFVKEEDANDAVRRAQGEANVEFGEQAWTTGVGSSGGLKLSFSTYPGWIEEPVAIVLCVEKVKVGGGASGDQAGS